ncbi:hypothetical protein POM88_046811 [Heracleum sosnowskyi]|uniref:Uncharacterized protein n=1 Tax=Heracleum sosnowskyi TaxID=360622 RepID=A0AAD8HA11_9APIA|nr:hypothetical protein POM88_046811 [Heracleum sosnowskyi]
MDLKIKLKQDYIDTLRQEEVFWRQKSRKKWVKEGDKNTHFFHLSATVRKKKQKILCIQDDDAQWQTDPSHLEIMKLSSLIDDVVDSKLWKPVSTSSNGPKISHQLFDDDLIIFGEASKTQLMGLTKTLNLDKYLGSPMLHGVIRHKYVIGRKKWSSQRGSPIWRNIKMAFPILREGIKWVVNNGTTTRFWTDHWVRENTLDMFISGPFSEEEKKHAVSYYWDSNDGWLWENMGSLPPNVKNLISVIRVKDDRNNEDRPI